MLKVIYLNIIVTIHLFLHIVYMEPTTYLPYKAARKALLSAENLLMTGGNIRLNSQELKVDELLIQYKLDELLKGFQHANQNAGALHYFKAKSFIDRSSVFKFLQQMPKGALLHVHNTASVSSKWVVRILSYTPGLLRCTNKDGVSILTFRITPLEHGCETQYVRVSDERHNSLDVEVFDQRFEQLINLYTPVPEFDYPTITSVWTKFQNMFLTLTDALHYLPVFRSYHWQMLEELYEDNIMYAEVRMSCKELYDINGRTFPKERTIIELNNIVNKFKRLHPSFLDAKIIIAVHRNADESKVKKEFDFFQKLHAFYPNFIIGFDLVGQEDLGKPLYSFVHLLKDLPKSARFFFHAGETNWFGASSDFNLVDALLLNTTRIGHGFALAKHPVLMNAIKSRDIAVEVSPISNQVLHLVSDLRNHPGGLYMSQNISIVICNDDPGFWDTKGVSYDFYYAIMSLAPKNAGLRMLKALVWNSINYSMMNESERKWSFNAVEQSWNKFIERVIQGNVF